MQGNYYLETTGVFFLSPESPKNSSFLLDKSSSFFGELAAFFITFSMETVLYILRVGRLSTTLLSVGGFSGAKHLPGRDLGLSSSLSSEAFLGGTVIS